MKFYVMLSNGERVEVDAAKNDEIVEAMRENNVPCIVRLNDHMLVLSRHIVGLDRVR